MLPRTRGLLLKCLEHSTDCPLFSVWTAPMLFPIFGSPIRNHFLFHLSEYYQYLPSYFFLSETRFISTSSLPANIKSFLHLSSCFPVSGSLEKLRGVRIYLLPDVHDCIYRHMCARVCKCLCAFIKAHPLYLDHTLFDKMWSNKPSESGFSIYTLKKTFMQSGCNWFLHLDIEEKLCTVYL